MEKSFTALAISGLPALNSKQTTQGQAGPIFKVLRQGGPATIPGIALAQSSNEATVTESCARRRSVLA